MWQELGIAPTNDEKAIRRAYARRLRAIGGDRDPAAFQRLRQAYESALAATRLRIQITSYEDDWGGEPLAEEIFVDGIALDARRGAFEEAANGTGNRRRNGAFHENDPRSDGGTAVGGDGSAAEARLVREDIRRALAIGETEAAFKHLRRALAQGLISLADQPDAILDVMSAAVEDSRLKGPVFRFMAEQLGWNRPVFFGDSVPRDIRERAILRYEGELWFEALAAAAGAQPRSPASNHKRWLARLFLGGGQGWELHILATEYLREQLGLYDQFSPWLQHRVYLGSVELLRSWLPHTPRMWIVVTRGNANHILLELPPAFYSPFSRRRDKWAINLERVHCPFCGEPAPMGRMPRNLRQALWGGWTCRKCRNEFDKFGKAIHR